MSSIVLANATTKPGATPEELLAFSQRTSMQIPQSMHELYHNSNGLTLASINTDFLPLSEIEAYIRKLRDYGITGLWRYIPFTECNDSNPYCVCGGGPLAGSVIHLFHDDEATLMFRSFESFLSALERGLDDGIEFLEELPSDFKSPIRTEPDLLLGQQLTELAKSLSESDRADALNFAALLLNKTPRK